jgi:hypothetical protein
MLQLFAQGYCHILEMLFDHQVEGAVVFAWRHEGKPQNFV